MIKDLEGKVVSAMHESIVSLVAKRHGISIEEARDITRALSFSDYVKLREDSTQLGGPNSIHASNHTGQAPTKDDTDADVADTNASNKLPNVKSAFDAGGNFSQVNAKTGSMAFARGTDGKEREVKIRRLVGAEYEVESDDGQIFKIPKGNMLGPKQLTDKSLLSKTSSFLGDVKRSMQRGYHRGASFANKHKVTMNNSTEHDEIRRLQELAGIEETATAGATGSGGVATVVGNTAHRPTDQLRARLRREKEKKKK